MARERNIMVRHFTVGRPQNSQVRRYAYIDTAVPRTIQLAMRDGKVGDVYEIAHNVTGLQIGTIKIKAAGGIETKFIWGDDYAQNPRE